MLNRRNFMKMCGVAVAAPMAIIKAKEQKVEELEIELTFPSGIWNAETGKTREFDTSNPADAVLYMTFKSMGKLSSIDIDYKAFDSWKRYCYERNLKCAIITKEKTLIECLCELGRIGQAVLYWDGTGGKLSVIYGLPEYVNGQAHRLGLSFTESLI